MAKRSSRDVVYVGKYGETLLGVGPHRGKPLYRVPQDYIVWCLENLPYASMLRQVLNSEDIRRRVDGVEPKRVGVKNKLAGDIEIRDVRQKRRSSNGCGRTVNRLVQAVRSCLAGTDQRDKRLRSVVCGREESGEETQGKD